MNHGKSEFNDETMEPERLGSPPIIAPLPSSTTGFEPTQNGGQSSNGHGMQEIQPELTPEVPGLDGEPSWQNILSLPSNLSNDTQPTPPLPRLYDEFTWPNPHLSLSELTEKLKRYPHSHDKWHQLIDMAENSGDIHKIREAYELLLSFYPNTVSNTSRPSPPHRKSTLPNDTRTNVLFGMERIALDERARIKLE